MTTKKEGKRTKKNVKKNVKNNVKKITKKTTKKIYNNEHYKSGDGMLTSVWGPSFWHVLHTISFNYPNEPTKEQKNNYKNFVLSLKNVLPCKYCRINLKNNFKALPLTNECMKNRETFSTYIYNLHELINKMLKKKSGLSYDDVRERYEHFRARCGNKKKKIFKFKKTIKKHKGCTEPLHKVKSKGIIKIVPEKHECESIEIDNKCTKVV